VTAMQPSARYAVACGIAPERDLVPERTFLSSPWSRGRVYLLSRQAASVVARTREFEEKMVALSDSDLGDRWTSLRSLGRRLQRDPEVAAEALAALREVARRSVGQRPFDEQVYAAFVLLRGGLVEMGTGEGKTLTAAVAAAMAAASGDPVHVLSSNDYLVARDAGSMAPIYARLGLRVGRVLGSEPDRSQRTAAYRCDVTYLTPRELAFDYLRDRRDLGDAGPLVRRVERIGRPAALGLRQRGLHFALIDEADDVLLDQASTPFVLSQAANRPAAQATLREAMRMARTCREGEDFCRSTPGASPVLTEDAEFRIRAEAEASGIWAKSSESVDAVRVAVLAIHGLTRDVDYVVHDGSVEIVNAPTGRRAPDQSFERGLHQFLELKEGLEPTASSSGSARIAGQSLFRRYRHMGAMTGTASDARGELWRIYGLPVVRVPLQRPSMRVAVGLACHVDEASQHEAIFARVATIHASGRPVLVGTGSIEASRRIAGGLIDRGIEPHVLNAADDAEEATIIAAAGAPGQVTVTTNLAGRGTDIALPPEAARRGGLHVICTRVGESRRVDRQLIGRCARQGDPGSFESILSLEDDVLADRLPAGVLAWLRERSGESGKLNSRLAQLLLWTVQMAEERRAEAARRTLLEIQCGRDQLLAFAGKSE
jgi:preprotein translocase subunit SecA